MLPHNTLTFIDCVVRNPAASSKDGSTFHGASSKRLNYKIQCIGLKLSQTYYYRVCNINKVLADKFILLINKTSTASSPARESQFKRKRTDGATSIVVFFLNIKCCLFYFVQINIMRLYYLCIHFIFHVILAV